MLKHQIYEYLLTALFVKFRRRHSFEVSCSKISAVSVNYTGGISIFGAYIPFGSFNANYLTAVEHREFMGYLKSFVEIRETLCRFDWMSERLTPTTILGVCRVRASGKKS